jgi:hypothetical protein
MLCYSYQKLSFHRCSIFIHASSGEWTIDPLGGHSSSDTWSHPTTTICNNGKSKLGIKTPVYCHVSPPLLYPYFCLIKNELAG